MAPILTSAGLGALGVLLCVVAARRTGGGPWLVRVLLAAYALRVGVAAGLYLVSAYQLPLFPSLQLSRSGDPLYDGFWRFAWDAAAYHQNGIRIAASLHAGEPLPPILVYGRPFLVQNTDFFYVVGAVYWLLGAHPLYVPLLNAALWTGIGVLGYVLARDLQGERAARIAAALLGFWPSTIVWSSQILKDTLAAFLLLLAIYLMIRIRQARPLRAAGAGVLAAAVIFELTRLRAYEASVLVVAVPLALGVTGLARLRALRAGPALRGLALVALVVVSHTLARSTLHVRGPRFPRVEATRPEPVEALPSWLQGLIDVGLEMVDRVAPSLAGGLRELGYMATHLPALVTFRRRAFIAYARGSNFAPDASFTDLWDLAKFLPRAVGHALYTPLPWEWFAPGETGAFKTLAGVETLLMVGLTPLMLLALRPSLRSLRFEAYVFLGVSALLFLALGVTVPNLGALFRLRIQALLPILVVVAAFGVPRMAARRPLDPGRSAAPPLEPTAGCS